MNGRSAASFALTIVLLGALMIASRPARAHEFKLESVMTGFVKIEPREAHLVIRVPLHVLRGIKFPLNGAEIALDKADPAIQQALELVGRQIALFEDGGPLVPTTALARLSLPSDRSFDSYQGAVNHVAPRQHSRTPTPPHQGSPSPHFPSAS